MSNSFYREIINEHNLRPIHKHILPRAGLSHRGVNPSCGDDITLQLTIEDGVIAEGAYSGNGCAISQASADMMLDLVIGKHKDEAKRLADIFVRMIKKEATEEEIEELEEAGSLRDISHMPSRVKCAVLGWHTMEELVDKEPIQNPGEHSGEAVSTE